MADSITAFLPLPYLPEDVHTIFKMPFVTLRSIDQDSVAGSAFHRWLSVKGLAKGMKFKVRGVFLEGTESGRLAGYEVKFNAPTCTVGNNVVLTNGVPRACELALLLLKCWLLAKGCPYHALDKLDFEDMKLLSVTPTFLHDCGSQAEAKNVRARFHRATTIRNVKSASGKSRKKVALTVGDAEDNNAYLHMRDHSVQGYVKDRGTKTVQVFSSPAIKALIFDEGERYFRLEPELNEVWLRKNGLDRVEAWRLYGSDSAYRKAYEQVRKDLRLDENLRSRKPKEEDIAKLPPVDQGVLRWHLSASLDQSTRDHPVFKEIKSLLARQKYFSAMKRRILSRLRVDISVPWLKQVDAASAEMGDFLQLPGMYAPPAATARNGYSPESVPHMVHELKVRLDKGRPRSIGRTHIPPDQRGSPLIRLGQLAVSPEARAHLDSLRQPLHPLLEAHMWGAFGDVSLDEVLALARAAGNHEPVTSRYTVGDKQITVTTEWAHGDLPSTIVLLTPVNPS